MDERDVAVTAHFAATYLATPVRLNGTPDSRGPYDVVDDDDDDEIVQLILQLSKWAQEVFPGEVTG
ncbi:MAG: hypothetical protein ACRDV9_11260 [Acidimicrobiia bacterium]